MSSIRIHRFAGTRPSVDARLLDNSEAQVAHNCLLEDGSLQAQAKWQVIGPATSSLCLGQANALYQPVPGYAGINFLGPPFGAVLIYLDDSGNIQPSVNGSASGAMSISRGFLSQKPVNRVYGVTSVKVIAGVAYESGLTLIDQTNPKDIIYEGDNITLSVQCTGQYARIYRSTSDVTTGTGTNGAVTANWQLVVDQMPNNSVFVDGGSSTDNPFDTYLYRGPLLQPFAAFRMGLLESGYVWLLSENGQLAFSERHTWGIWPVEHVYTLGAGRASSALVITGVASVGDRLYVGTQQGAFFVEIHTTDDGKLVANPTPIAKAEPCLHDTMVATPSGAMYTSAQGVVALQGAEAVMLTKDIARGSAGKLPDGTEVLFSSMGAAIYHNGRYYAFEAALPA